MLEASQKWSIGRFYGQAWKLAWQHKVLWILGMAVVLYASGSYRANTFSRPAQNSTQPQKVSALILSPSSLPAASAPPTAKDSPFVDAARQAATHVHPAVYVLLFIEITAFVIAVLVFRFVLLGWSKSALIIGVHTAAEKKTINLTEIARAAMQRIRPMIFLNLVPVLLLLAIALIVAIAFFLIAAVAKILIIPLVLVYLIGAVYLVFRLGSALIYAERYCALEKFSGKTALEKGDELAKGNLWKSGRLAILNWIVGLISQVLVTVLFLGAFVLPFGFLWIYLKSPLIVLLVPLAVIILMFALWVSAFWKVFTYAAWHFAFRYLDDKKRVAA